MVEKDWKSLGTAGPRNTTFIWQMPSSVLSGSYEIYVIPDNVDRSGLVGKSSSCFADGFPLGAKVSFRILSLPSVNPDSFGKDNYAPSTSDSPKNFASLVDYLWMLGAGLFYVFYI